MKKTIVLDLGGTHLKYALMSEAGNILYHNITKTPNDYTLLIRTIHDIITSFNDQSNTLIIAIPGVYNKATDQVLFAPNLDYLIGKHLIFDIRDNFTSKSINIYIENDANLAALGEYRYGFDVSPSSMVMFTLGTGVGGGIILDRKLLTGDVTKCELGHVTVVAEGRQCSCGKRGCIEKYCSVSAIIADFKEASGTKDEVDLEDVLMLYREGEFAAFAALDFFALHLSHGVSSIINLLSPQAVRIGGGLSELADYFFPQVLEHMERLVFPAYRGLTDVSIAKLKNHAALMGGAVLANDIFYKNEP